MKGRIVRLTRISIENFKNVSWGDISLENTNSKYKASVLGLYGQNGSGKTALIDALFLLKYLLCGAPVPNTYADYVSVGVDYSRMIYHFKVTSPAEDINYDISYEFKLQKNPSIIGSLPEQGTIINAVEIFDEVLSYSYLTKHEKEKMGPVIDTNTELPFVPKTKYDLLTNKNKSLMTNLLVAKKLARITSRSFVFSKELLDVIREHCIHDIHKDVIESIVYYGNYELFVYDTRNTGLIALNALPLSLKYESNGIGIAGSFMLPLDNAALIPDQAFELVKKAIDSINIVLCQLVPCLTIKIVKLGTQLLPDNSSGVRVQLQSCRDGKTIPLAYESEGIKKIFSILQLLINVYNNPSITVAIDELDSGIFEYLLGELLRIISEKGKGQLIFTAHNLRALETIDKGFVAFTTVNPNNRYIRLTNVKPNNNLRDFYYRDIIVDEQNETLYESTNNSMISLAFREAGENCAT